MKSILVDIIVCKQLIKSQVQTRLPHPNLCHCLGNRLIQLLLLASSRLTHPCSYCLALMVAEWKLCPKERKWLLCLATHWMHAFLVTTMLGTRSSLDGPLMVRHCGYLVSKHLALLVMRSVCSVGSGLASGFY
jgi:hypothetical protein